MIETKLSEIILIILKKKNFFYRFPVYLQATIQLFLFDSLK